MSYVINVDLENLNYPDRTPPDCAFHPYARPHYDLTIHDVRHAKSTNRPMRFWIKGLETVAEARKRAEEEKARWPELPVEIREHTCITDE
jgi:hypothetical protein